MLHLIVMVPSPGPALRRPGAEIRVEGPKIRQQFVVAITFLLL